MAFSVSYRKLGPQTHDLEHHFPTLA
jgi:hypothetical protein